METVVRHTQNDAGHLEAIVILVMAQFTDAVSPCMTLLTAMSGIRFAVAQASSTADRERFHSIWSDGAPPLLLMRQTSGGVNPCLEAVLHLAGRHAGRPVAVLLADGPEIPGYRASKREQWSKEFADSLDRALPDVQVFQFSPSWMSRPPRIR